MADVTFTYNPTPAPACYPSDVNALAQLLTTGGVLNGTVPDNSGGGIYVGTTPPSSALTNKVWFKTDGLGRPVGAYMFYSGNWRKVWTGVGIGEIRFYSGSAAAFDGNGLGVVGGDMDGWQLCNGNNGTPALDSKFPCMSSVNASGVWTANPENSSTRNNSGGIGTNTIQCHNLPDLWAQSQATAVSPGAGIQALTISGGSPVNLQILDLVNSCQPVGQVPFDNTPPWVAFAAIQFIGY